MGVIAEERQRRGRPRAATNPKGTWGLRPHASLLVVNDATRIVSSSRLAWDSQAPCARPMPLLGHTPDMERPVNYKLPTSDCVGASLFLEQTRRRSKRLRRRLITLIFAERALKPAGMVVI